MNVVRDDTLQTGDVVVADVWYGGQQYNGLRGQVLEIDSWNGRIVFAPDQEDPRISVDPMPFRKMWLSPIQLNNLYKTASAWSPPSDNPWEAVYGS